MNNHLLQPRRFVTIDVTKDDIDDAATGGGAQGSRCNAESCPVNRAARRAFGVETRTFRPYIAVGDSEVLAWMPRDAQDRVLAYDRGYGMTPFTFELEDPR
jgi:hypothetical protein